MTDEPQPDLREQLAAVFASACHPVDRWTVRFEGLPETLADAALAVVRPLLDAAQAELDAVAGRATAAITGMGADVRRMRGERDRYRLAYRSARSRGARASGTLDGVQSNLAAAEAARDQWEQRYDAETMSSAGIFHTYYRRWQGTIAEARRQKARADKATARGDIWKAKAVAIEQDRDALLNQPALRLCVYPHCLRQFDLTGRPARPEWSSEGWLQVRAVDGYVCPDHAAAVRVHTPRWLATGKFLVCSCGWESPAVRWRGYGAEAWKDHLLTETEPS